MAHTLLASIDGKIDAPERVNIAVVDDGLLRGDGAFEVVKLYDGHPFRLQDHLLRLRRSSAAIELRYDETTLEAEIEEILDRGVGPDGCLRIVVTRGGRRVLAVEETPSWAEQVRVALIAAEPATLLTGVKSISYAANMQATRLAQGRGADEAILVSDDGRVLESPTSSVFWADAGGKLHTPALTEGILDSITRAAILEELPVAEGRYGTDDILAASEAFLASTTREIQPISAIDAVELARVDGSAANAARAVLRSAVERDATR